MIYHDKPEPRLTVGHSNAPAYVTCEHSAASDKDIRLGRMGVSKDEAKTRCMIECINHANSSDSTTTLAVCQYVHHRRQKVPKATISHSLWDRADFRSSLHTTAGNVCKNDEKLRLLTISGLLVVACHTTKIACDCWQWQRHPVQVGASVPTMISSLALLAS